LSSGKWSQTANTSLGRVCKVWHQQHTMVGDMATFRIQNSVHPLIFHSASFGWKYLTAESERRNGKTWLTQPNRAEKLLPTVNQPKSLCQHNTLHKGVLLSVSPTRAVIIIPTMHSSCHHTATAIRLICIWLNPFSTMTFPQAGYQGIPGFTGVISRTRS